MYVNDDVVVDFVSAAVVVAGGRPISEEELKDPEEEAVEEALRLKGVKKNKRPWVTPFDKWPKLADVDENLVFGVDPGRQDMVTAASVDVVFLMLLFLLHLRIDH